MVRRKISVAGLTFHDGVRPKPIVNGSIIDTVCIKVLERPVNIEKTSLTTIQKTGKNLS